MTIRGIVLYTGQEELSCPLHVAERALASHFKGEGVPYWPRVWVDMENAARKYAKEQEATELRRG